MISSLLVVLFPVWSYPATPPSSLPSKNLPHEKVKTLSVRKNLAYEAKQSAPLLKHPATAARMLGGCTSSYEAKAPLRQEFQRPLVLSKPLPLLV